MGQVGGRPEPTSHPLQPRGQPRLRIHNPIEYECQFTCRPTAWKWILGRNQAVWRGLGLLGSAPVSPERTPGRLPGCPAACDRSPIQCAMPVQVTQGNTTVISILDRIFQVPLDSLEVGSGG